MVADLQAFVNCRIVNRFIIPMGPSQEILTIERFNNGTVSAISTISRGDNNPEWAAAINAWESLLIALASEGFDLNALGFQRAAETALDAISDQYGE